MCRSSDVSKTEYKFSVQYVGKRPFRIGETRRVVRSDDSTHNMGEDLPLIQITSDLVFEQIATRCQLRPESWIEGKLTNEQIAAALCLVLVVCPGRTAGSSCKIQLQSVLCTISLTGHRICRHPTCSTHPASSSRSADVPKVDRVSGMPNGTCPCPRHTCGTRIRDCLCTGQLTYRT